MTLIFDILILLAVGVCVVPTLLFFVECLIGSLPSRFTNTAEDDRRPSVGILMPAHDESVVIAGTIDALKPQLCEGDRLLVVADNCSDDTADIAKRHGAEVTVREHAQKRGKGWALEHGRQVLAHDPPEVLVILDADCELSPGTLDRLAIAAMRRNAPVQSAYLMPPPANPSPKDLVSAFAVTVKNVIRPRGLARLGWPCMLSGSGMAFPWKVLADVPFAGGHIGEDYQFSAEIALAGYPATFLEGAVTRSSLPANQKAVSNQRRRWGHAHLQVMAVEIPRLLRVAWRKRDFRLLALAWEISVPPLTLLVGMWFVLVGLGLIALLWGSFWPLISAGTGFGLIIAGIAAAWWPLREDYGSWRIFLAVPKYCAMALGQYGSFWFNRESQWIKTARETPPSTSNTSPHEPNRAG